MIFRTGSGSLRTSVGTARIWSPLASCGFFSRSITSMRYWPARCSSQIFLRLAKAATPAASGRRRRAAAPRSRPSVGRRFGLGLASVCSFLHRHRRFCRGLIRLRAPRDDPLPFRRLAALVPLPSSCRLAASQLLPAMPPEPRSAAASIWAASAACSCSSSRCRRSAAWLLGERLQPGPWPPGPAGPSRSAPCPGRRRHPAARCPSSLSRNSRIWLEWAMPAALEDVQDAVALAARLQHPQQQPGVHQRGDAHLALLQRRSPPAVRLVKTVVMPWFLRKSISRVSIDLDLVGLARR